MLRQRVQHMIQEPDPGGYGDLLCCGELGRMAGVFWGDDAGVGVVGKVGGMLIRRERTTVEGEGDLDLGLVGITGEGGSSGAHCWCIRMVGGCVVAAAI